ILYALSTGLGHDPLDARQLDFVDHHRALRALPWMAVVLGHPGFWLSDPRTGIDAVRVVHGEQGIECFRPLPVEGEIVGRTRITGLVDKGKGRGALLYSEKQVTDAASGERLAITRSTTFLRGDGGFGGSSASPSPPPRPVHSTPETPPDFTVDLPTRPEQALLYRLNGDDNPLHADPAFAARAGFPRPILHGLCTLGVVAHALLRALGDYDTGSFQSLALRFSAPVLPGETIRTEIWRSGAFRALVPERDTVVVTNGHAIFHRAS
ncbi:MAG TPA: MaoC/PaaZ C-terminal domain-containing protein, partial [Acidiphilium sp.]